MCECVFLWMLWAKVFLQSAACVLRVSINTCELKRRYTKWLALLRFIITSFIIYTFRILCAVSQTINRPFGTLATYNYWMHESNKNGNNFSITLSLFPRSSSPLADFVCITKHSLMIFVGQQSDIAIDRYVHWNSEILVGETWTNIVSRFVIGHSL